MSHLSLEDGVPSLSPADRLVLLRGRGKCKAIKDIALADEGEGKGKRKWSVISDTEDESDSAEEFVQNVPKLTKRTTPKRKAKGLTPNVKKSSLPRTKYVEREAQWECSPVPPVRRQAELRSSLASQDSKQKKTNISNVVNTIEKLGVTDSEVSDDKQKDNDNVEITEVSDVFQSIGSGLKEQGDGIATEVIKIDDNNKSQSSKEKENLVPPDRKLDAAFLPPGYGADNLAQVLICLLEEKVRVSSSHSERELFRKTIHVLLCGGCKDREKHNKMRCKRCEDRDTRKMEDKKGKRSEKSDLSIRNDKNLGKSIDKADRKEADEKDTIKKTAPKMQVSKESSKKHEPAKTTSSKSKDRSVLSELDVCCEKCGLKFKELKVFKQHNELPHEHECRLKNCEMSFVNQNYMDLHIVKNHRNVINQDPMYHQPIEETVQTNEKEGNMNNLATEIEFKTDKSNNKTKSPFFGNITKMDTASIVDRNSKLLEADQFHSIGKVKCPEFVNINEDIGNIDRDAIFSDASDEPMEAPVSVEDLVFSTDACHAAHVELIHDDEINTELAIARHSCGNVNDQVAGDTTNHRGTAMKGGNIVNVEKK